MAPGADETAAGPSGADRAVELTAAPLTTRGVRTRSRILAAAADLMFERGAGATRLADIKAVAGVSSSQVYHYFADKQALMRAVVGYHADRVVATQCAVDLSTAAGLRAWGQELVAREKDRQRLGGCSLTFVGGELAETDQHGRQEAAAGFRHWAAAIGAGLHAMRAAGRLPASADPEALALALLASVQGGLLLARVQHDVAPLQAAVDASVQLIELLGGCAAPGREETRRDVPGPGAAPAVRGPG